MLTQKKATFLSYVTFCCAGNPFFVLLAFHHFLYFSFAVSQTFSMETWRNSTWFARIHDVWSNSFNPYIWRYDLAFLFEKERGKNECPILHFWILHPCWRAIKCKKNKQKSCTSQQNSRWRRSRVWIMMFLHVITFKSGVFCWMLLQSTKHWWGRKSEQESAAGVQATQ